MRNVWMEQNDMFWTFYVIINKLLGGTDCFWNAHLPRHAYLDDDSQNTSYENRSV